MNTWATRIKTRMKELGMTQEMLASKLNVTRGAITHYLAGRRVPPLKQFHKLAVILKTDPAWLQFGIDQNEGLTKKQKKSSANIEHKVIERHPIPLLSWEQAAEYIDVSRIKKEEIKEFFSHFYADQPRWYALRVKGDSMTASLGHTRSFLQGDTLIIDPDKEAQHGDYVVALLPKSKEATFKQYVIDGGIRYLKPLNSQYPTMQVEKGTHICGVIVNCILNLK